MLIIEPLFLFKSDINAFESSIGAFKFTANN